ncbi:hypothetical protein [Modestobacter sp. NPDC049651]|uniref:hypothetical protein n=1 Tax=unclassified Modestobacter TaxID=2643866 RepID=UPI0033EF505B
MPIDAGSLHFAVGPAIALLVLGVLSLFLRWAFSGPAHTRRRGDRGELLTRVATVSRPETAQALRAVLSDAGIRSTVRTPAPYRTDVLVFPEDADRARALAMTFGDG